MRKLKIFFVLALFLLVPQASFAYLSTDQSALRLNSETVLYTVTYRFSSDTQTLHVPIGAVRGVGFKGDSPYLGYDLYNGELPWTGGAGYALVLSKARIENGQYRVPKGETATFTLVTLLKLSAADFSPEKKLDLSLRVTSLPFMITKDGKTFTNKLNPGELQYYRTPSILLSELKN